MIQFSGGSQWRGIEGIEREALMAEIRPRAQNAVRRAALYFEGEMKRTLTGPRTGRTYKVSRTGKLHVAAAPGEPPAVLFGVLRGSVGHSEPEWIGDTVSSDVGPGAGIVPAPPYWLRQEYGGADSRGVVIPAHPYIAPTVERVRATIERMFEEFV